MRYGATMFPIEKKVVKNRNPFTRNPGLFRSDRMVSEIAMSSDGLHVAAKDVYDHNENPDEANRTVTVNNWGREHVPKTLVRDLSAIVTHTAHRYTSTNAADKRARASGCMRSRRYNTKRGKPASNVRI